METILLIVMLILLLGGGGSYFAYNRYGTVGSGSLLAVLLFALVALWIFSELSGMGMHSP